MVLNSSLQYIIMIGKKIRRVTAARQGRGPAFFERPGASGAMSRVGRAWPATRNAGGQCPPYIFLCRAVREPPYGNFSNRVLTAPWPGDTEEKFMALTRDEVLHVANLARLSLGPEEIELFTRQLNDILA